MRITESQLRRIIRQEVRRARITEMAAPRGVKYQLTVPVFPGEPSDDGFSVSEMSNIANNNKLGGKLIRDNWVFTGTLAKMENVARVLDAIWRRKFDDPHDFKSMIKELSPSAASRSMAQLVFDEYMLADAGGAFEDPRATVKSLTKKAESMGLTASPDAMGTGLTVSGDPRKLKAFANELEIDYAGGMQSAPSGEDSLASMIEYI